MKQLLLTTVIALFSITAAAQPAPPVPFSPGHLTSTNGIHPRIICSGENPGTVTMHANPVGGSEQYVYRWYLWPSSSPVAPPPEGPELLWSSRPYEQTGGASFTPTTEHFQGASGLNLVCRVAEEELAEEEDAWRWASGGIFIRQQGVLQAPFVVAGDEAFCGSGDPAPIHFDPNYGFGVELSWRWYYRESAAAACPTGTGVPSGWLTNNVSTGITGNSIDWGWNTAYPPPFDPISAGTTANGGRSFAVLISPYLGTNTTASACATERLIRPQWAEGCRKTYVHTSSAFNRGTLAEGNQTIAASTQPEGVAFSVSPAPAAGYTLQWYYKEGIAAAPTGNSTAGWINTGATGAWYQPPVLNNSRTYACYVTPVGSCGSAGWATGARQITVTGGGTAIHPGALVAEGGVHPYIICADETPDTIRLAVLPEGGSGNYSYRWYLKPDPFPFGGDPTSEGSLWNIVLTGYVETGGPSYLPNMIGEGLSIACKVAPAGEEDDEGAWKWAAGSIFIRKQGALQAPFVVAGDEVFCGSGDPAPIHFDPSYGLGIELSWRWYYRESAAAACPTGTGIPSGWLTNNVSTGITGNSLDWGWNTAYPPPFDPVGAGTTANGGRSFAVFITPSLGANTLASACATERLTQPQWAEGCRKTSVHTSSAFNRGTLAEGDQTIAAGTQPEGIAFSISPAPAAGYTLQWYYKEGIVAPPASNSTTGWINTGATGAWYQPPVLNNSRTYACYVMPAGSCGTIGWATGARRITVTGDGTTFHPGALVAAGGVQPYIICAGETPDTIRLAVPPTGGSGNYVYRWYVQAGLQPFGGDPVTNEGSRPWHSREHTLETTDPFYVPKTGNLSIVCKTAFVPTDGSRMIWHWAGGNIFIREQGALQAPFVVPGDEVFCSNGDPAPIHFDPNYGLGVELSWRWYYRESAAAACPTGTGIPSGWLTNNVSTGITGNSLDWGWNTAYPPPFDPVGAGTTANGGRSFAVFITPSLGANTIASACAAKRLTRPQWAEGCRKTYVHASSFIYPESVISFAQGVRKNGTIVSAAESNVSKALAAPQMSDLPTGIPNYVSLGFGGSITLELERLAFRTGAMNEIQVFETTSGDHDTLACNWYPERALIEGSLDGINWVNLGTVCRDGIVGIPASEYLRSATGPSSILEALRYIRVTDFSGPSNPVFPGSENGYDLDGLRVLSCPVPAPRYGYDSADKADDINTPLNNQPDVRLYPNPATDLFRIELPADNNATRIRITDMSGKTLLQTTVFSSREIGIQHLRAGMYLVSVEQEHHLSHHRLIKLTP